MNYDLRYFRLTSYKTTHRIRCHLNIILKYYIEVAAEELHKSASQYFLPHCGEILGDISIIIAFIHFVNEMS